MRFVIRVSDTWPELHNNYFSPLNIHVGKQLATLPLDKATADIFYVNIHLHCGVSFPERR
jgi:hypothetical protein